jgi:Fe-S oxidoreductase
MTDDRITFWFGCNMLRHAEMIRLSILLLEKVGYDVRAAGGPAYCCGTAHDHQPRAASNMSARTVSRFNEAAETEGRGKVVTWCPSCHMHMADIMAPGNPTAFDIAHITELLAARADRLEPLLTHRVERRVLLHRHLGFATHVAVNDAVRGVLTAIAGLEVIDGPAVPGHMCSALEATPGATAKAAKETWDVAAANRCDTLATIFHSCHRILTPSDGRQGVVVRN